MGKNLILMFCILFPLEISAQDKKDNKSKEADEPNKAEIVISSKYMGLKAIAEELAEKRKEIATLRDSIQQQEKKYTTEKNKLQERSDSLICNKQKEVDILNETIKIENLEIIKLNNEIEKVKGKQVAIDFLNNIIFKQCLLYSLEIRYNQEFIKEAQDCLIRLGIMEIPKYEETCSVYWNMLGQYDTFNNELINYLENQFISFNLKQWKINEVVSEGALNKLKQLSYYPYYEKHNQEPWQSIIYIDNVIDDYCNMLQGKKAFNKESYQELIDRLKPKAK